MRPIQQETFRLVAWTGGTSPRPLGTIGRGERLAVKALFREQLSTWRDFWGDFPDKDTRRIFWGRARYDAHSSFRHGAA